MSLVMARSRARRVRPFRDSFAFMGCPRLRQILWDSRGDVPSNEWERR
jgi:hypothetical protein